MSAGVFISQVGRAAARAFRQPVFIVAAVVLCVAAIGLNGAVAQLHLHFKKLPVPLARELNQIKPSLGPWVQVSRDEPLDREIQDTLATDKYIFRDYVNVDAHDGMGGELMLEALHKLAGDLTAEGWSGMKQAYLAQDTAGRQRMLLDAVKDKSNTDRQKLLIGVQQAFPDSVINMAVTYYTGLVDTVAHIPDRCYIASGFEPTDYDYPTWSLSNGVQLPVRFINFEDQNGVARIDRSVAYFFNVNGSYESNPLRVRGRLQNLTEKYGYYAKVELMTLDPNHERSAKTMTDFLGQALPEVEKSFPDWYKVNHPAQSP